RAWSNHGPAQFRPRWSGRSAPLKRATLVMDRSDPAPVRTTWFRRSPWSQRLRRLRRIGLVPAAVALTTIGLSACGGADTALMRGDRLWADSSYADALAEYILAVRQGADHTALARVAHTYGQVGDIHA